MSVFSERLEELLAKNDISAAELSRATGIPESAISNYRAGNYEAKQRRLEQLSRALHTTPAYLMGWEDHPIVPPGFEPAPRMVKRPLVGDIACGQPILAEENIDDYIDVPEDIRCDFCLRCHGDSMIDAGIRDRDVVYIRIQPEVENGQIAAVRIGDEATLKRVYWDESKQLLTLLPANTAYSPMVLSGPALEDVQIEGRAVGYTHWMD